MPAWAQRQHITPDDAHEPGWGGNPSHWGMFFGSTVSIDGDTMAASTQLNAHRDKGASVEGGGDWVYLFERGPHDAWVQTAKLIPKNPELGDSFGYSLALDEDAGVLVAGNPAGERVHIFERTDDGAWQEDAVFERPHAGCHVCLGYTVAVSGTNVVSGVEDTLYVFEKRGDDGQWIETAALEGGLYVDLSGDTLATSVWDPTAGFNRFQIYEHEAGSWRPTTLLDPSQNYDSEATQAGPMSLSDDGATLVLGLPVDQRVLWAETEPVQGGVAAAVGSVWIFEKRPEGWELVADIPNPDPAPFESFGRSVAVSGSRVVVGSPGDALNGGPGAGAAYIYERIGEEWTLISRLRNTDASEGDVFGEAVDISGTTVTVGAPFDNNRRDGSPPPLDDRDEPDNPPGPESDGEYAGSVYIFEPIEDRLGAVSADPYTAAPGSE